MAKLVAFYSRADENYFGGQYRYIEVGRTMPMAVYTFLENYDFSGKKIYPFCTHEGSGLSRTEKDIQKAAKGAKVEKGLAIHGSSVDSARNTVEKWLK